MHATFTPYEANMNTSLNSALPDTINLCINSRCNFHCKHCYATFQDIPGAKLPSLSEADALAIIEMIAQELLPEDMIARKITFVEGEPTLCPFLPELVGYSKSLGLVTAVITNGTTSMMAGTGITTRLPEPVIR